MTRDVLGEKCKTNKKKPVSGDQWIIYRVLDAKRLCSQLNCRLLAVAHVWGPRRGWAGRSIWKVSQVTLTRGSLMDDSFQVVRVMLETYWESEAPLSGNWAFLFLMPQHES